MAEPTPGTGATEVLHSPSGKTSPAVSVRPFPVGRCKLIAGERWRGYQIDAPAYIDGGNVFEATDIGRMEKVLISASLVNKLTAARRSVWELISTKLPPKTRILRCWEAHEEDGWRYEVVNQPPATTLREWIACHQAEPSTQWQLLEQLSETLGTLHSMGIVHLNIRPELIYLEGEGNSVEFVLGGLDRAAFYKQAGFATYEVDPFYAPPEAVDPEGAKPGIGLCAWDWWSLGRVIQEMILGRHVMSLLFGSDVIRDPRPETRERARSLLLELEPPGMRAGAVESMPEQTPAVKAMLRGLLTSARDARWGGEVVRLWLGKESVSNYYDLARNARLFTWKGRGRSLSEAAQLFRTDEHWAAGEQNIFEPDNPETLAFFLKTIPEHSADLRKFQQVQSRLELPELGHLSEAARRSVVAAFIWLSFGPQPGALIVKGRRMDGKGLTELLGNTQDSSNYEIVKTFLSVSCLAMIAPLDAPAAEILTQLGALGGMALQKAEEQGWVDKNDWGSQAHVLKLSLEPEPALRKRVERIRTTYATCENTILAGMLADKSPAPWAQLLLVITGENPRRFGYVTRAEHARQNIGRLSTRGQQLQAAMFWLNLQKMLLAGRPWSGDWQTFAVFWLCLVVFGVTLAKDIPSTAAIAFSLMGLRFLLGWRVRKLSAHCDSSMITPWNWRDGPARCLSEAQRIWPETMTSMPALTKQLDEVKAAMTALQPGENKTSASDRPSELTGLWLVYAATAIVCVIGSIQLLKNLGQNLGYESLSIAWIQPDMEIPAADGNRLVADKPAEIVAQLEKLPGLAPEMVEKVKRGEYEIVKESFGYTLHGPIQQWAFTPPAVVPALPVESRAPATSAQRAFALVSGELLMRPYGKKGATALLVVPVPTKTGFGVMVYNAKAKKLVDNVALTLHDGLPNNTWYHLERFTVIYLGAPSQMDSAKEGLLSQR